MANTPEDTLPDAGLDLSLEPEQSSLQSERPKPLDPARVAMRVMLSRALVSCQVSTECAGRDGIVVVVSLPTAPWTHVALQEWQSWIRCGEQYEDGFHSHRWSNGSWYVWAAKANESTSALNTGAENFANALGKVKHCAAFTADLAWLPPEIVHGVDYHLALQPMTAVDLGMVAAEVCGGKPEEVFSDEQANALTPRLLRLARRPGQDADAYLRKLRLLLERDLASAATQLVPAVRDTPRQTPTLDRLHGMDEAVGWGMSVAKDLRRCADGEIAWADVDRGCLLSGPPGCGKTLFARGLAATLQRPLVSGSYHEWHGTGSAHQGDLLKAMKGTFTKARSSAPCVLFIDEVDSFPNRGMISHKWADWEIQVEIQVVNALLAEIDGVEGRDGVILVAACNHPEKLDPALVRSGRLDRHIRVELPDRSALAAIFREHLGVDLDGEDLSSASLAAMGSSGADCERFVRGARRRARNAGRVLTLADLMDEIGGGDERTASELWIAAIHEAGHAVASCELQPGTLRAVTLRATGDQGGGVMAGSLPAYITASDVHRGLVLLLAGRAAEDVFLGMPTSGAGGGSASDLAQATRLAATAATALGLDETIGLIWSGVPDAANLGKMLRNAPGVAARIRAVVDEAYSDSLALIRRRTAAVQALATVLLKKRALDGEEAAAIAAQHPGEAAA